MAAKETLIKMLEKVKVDDKFTSPSRFEIFLLNHYAQLQWMDNPTYIPLDAQQKFDEWKAQFAGNNANVEERKAYFMKTISLNKCFEDRAGIYTYISPSNLMAVIEAVGKKSICRKIKIPLSDVPPEVLKTLQKYGFKQNREHGWQFSR